MEIVSIPCPECGHPLQLRDRSLLGQAARCPECRHKFLLEERSEPQRSDDSLSGRETIAPGKLAESLAEPSAESEPVLKEFGRYRLLRELGQGAMGTVYLAHDVQVGRRVALKIPKFGGNDDSELLERFYREARSAATLRHPNICPVFDVGEVEGAHYLTMAYIEGHTLSSYISHKSEKPERQVVGIVRKLASALEHAHEHGVVHRDLKPGNIMIDKRNDPIVMDFGLALQLETSSERLTQTGMVLGTPHYMSPEQVRAEWDQVGPCSDIFSLGVILYELLTGEIPFDGSVGVVMANVLTQEPPKPSEFRADLSPILESICLKMMAKKIDGRYQSMREVNSALVEFLKDPKAKGKVSTTTEPAQEKSDTQSHERQTIAAQRRQTIASPTRETMPVTSPRRTVKATAKGTGKELAAELYQAAKKCMEEFDYDKAVVLLEQIPAAHRTEKVRTLLEEVQLNEEIPPRALGGRSKKSKRSRREAKRGWFNSTVVYGGLAGCLVLIASIWVLNAVLRHSPGDPPTTKVNSENVAQPSATTPKTLPPANGKTPVAKSTPDVAKSPPPAKDDAPADAGGIVTVEKVFVGHTNSVNTVAFSPSGQVVLSADSAGNVIFWNRQTGNRLNSSSRFNDKNRHVSSATYSPKEGNIVVAGRSSLWILNRTDGKELFALPGTSRDAETHPWATTADHVVMSPDDRYVLLRNSRNSLVQLDVESGQKVELRGHTGAITSAAYSPDGRFIASAGYDRTIRIWDSATRQETQRFDLQFPANKVAFSPDGRLAGAAPRSIQMWDLETKQQVREFHGYGAPAHSLTFSPDGRYLLAGSEGRSRRGVRGSFEYTVTLWDTETAEQPFEFQGNSYIAHGVAFSPDGQYILTGGPENVVRLWKLWRIPGKKAAGEPVGGGPTSATPQPVTPTNAGSSASKPEAVGQATKTFEGHTDIVLSVNFSPDGRNIVSGSRDKTLRVWDVNAGSETMSLNGHNRDVESAAFSPDGRKIVSGSMDGTVRIWDSGSGREVLARNAGIGMVKGVSFSPNGERIVCGGGAYFKRGLLKIWESSSGKFVHALVGHTDIVQDVAFSPDGQRVVSAGYDKLLKVWNTEDGQEILTLRGHNDPVLCVAFSPDGRKIVSGSSHIVNRRIQKYLKVWNAESGELEHDLKGHTSAVNGVAFSPDGTRIASGGYDKTVKVWDVASGRLLLTLEGHTESVTSVSFSPDGRWIVSGSRDKTLKLWDVADYLKTNVSRKTPPPKNQPSETVTSVPKTAAPAPISKPLPDNASASEILQSVENKLRSLSRYSYRARLTQTTFEQSGQRVETSDSTFEYTKPKMNYDLKESKSYRNKAFEFDGKTWWDIKNGKKTEFTHKGFSGFHGGKDAGVIVPLLIDESAQRTLVRYNQIDRLPDVQVDGVDCFRLRLRLPVAATRFLNIPYPSYTKNTFVTVGKADLLIRKFSSETKTYEVIGFNPTTKAMRHSNRVITTTYEFQILEQTVNATPLPRPPVSNTGKSTSMSYFTYWDAESNARSKRDAKNTNRKYDLRFFLNGKNGNRAYLLPVNGAEMAVVSGQSFAAIDLSHLKRLTYSTSRHTRTASRSAWRTNNIFAIKTAQGNYVKLQVTRYRAVTNGIHSITFDYVVYPSPN